MEPQASMAINRFSEWLAKPAKSDDINRENLNKFVQHIQDIRSNTTADQYRRSLCRGRNHLTEFEDKPACEIKRLRRPKPEEIVVVAWTVEEFDLLLKGAAEVVGKTRGTNIPGNLPCSALLWVEYNTGLRPSDLFRLKWSQIDFKSKSIALIQHKTKKPHLTFLDDPAIKSMEAIFSDDREQIFPVTWTSTRK